MATQPEHGTILQLCDISITYANAFVEIGTQMWRSGTRTEMLWFRRFYPYLPEKMKLSSRNQMGPECVEGEPLNGRAT
jgi:hypothetical protein